MARALLVLAVTVAVLIATITIALLVVGSAYYPQPTSPTPTTFVGGQLA